MFPITHLFFYSMVFPDKDTGAAVGSIFPDTTILSGLRWPETHRKSVEFYNNLSVDEKIKFSSFVRGFLSHAVDSEGLDYFGDEKYGNFEKGYSYYLAGPIVPDVIESCKVPESMGLWKAHNIIEMGIESLIANGNSEIREWVKRTWKDTTEIKRIAQLLSKFYLLSDFVFEKSINDFINFMRLSGDPRELGESYARVLSIKHGIIDADSRQIARVIEKAREIVRSEYMSFLKECRKKFLMRWGGLL